MEICLLIIFFLIEINYLELLIFTLLQMICLCTKLQFASMLYVLIRKKSKFKINKEKIKYLIKGYESINKISIKEKQSLNISM